MNSTDLTGTWTLDPAHSEIGFSVRHAGISKVRGRFTEVSATVVHEHGASTVEATAQAASFESGNADRDAHIRSADFLDVEAYPTVDFKGVHRGGDLSGELTIHGVTKPVTFSVDVVGQAVDPFGNTRLGLEATTTINRKDFGLTWNAPLQAGAGMLVGDKVTVELELSFIKEA